MEQTSDRVLLKRWRRHRDADAFNDIVSRHADMVYSTSRRILGNDADAQDVAQDCFLKLSQATGEIRTSLAGWLHRLARHRSLNAMKRESRRRKREERGAVREGTAEEPGWAEIRAYVDEAIDRLPEDIRSVVVGHFLERQTYDAIARRSGITPRMVSYGARKGIEAIRRHLKQRGVSIGSSALATMLSRHLVEASPIGLHAALGKLALAGTGGRDGLPGTEESCGLDTASSHRASIARSSKTTIGARMGTNLKMALGGAALLVTVIGLIAYFASSAPDRDHDAAAAPGNERTLPDPTEPTVESEPEAPATGVVSGRIVDELTLELIPGALVTTGERTVRTDEDGVYEIRGLIVGQVRVEVSAAGYTSRSLVVDIGRAQENRFDVELSQPIEILCIDRQDEPVPGAEVYLVQLGGQRGHRNTHTLATSGPKKTGDDGRVRFPEPVRLEEGGWDRFIYARVPGHLVGAARSMKGRDWESNTEPPVGVVMIESLEVTGNVTVPDGFSPTAVRVWAMGLSFRDGTGEYGSFWDDSYYEHDSSIRPLFERRPDADGRFVFADIPEAGTLRLAAAGPGLGRAQAAIRDPSEDDEILLNLREAGRLEGTLTFGPDGDPAPGLTVSARQRHAVARIVSFEAVVKEDGSFAITELPGGVYSLQLEDFPDEWTMRTQEEVGVSAGRVTVLELRLERGALVRGQVVDAQSREPIADVTINAVHPGMRGRGVGRFRTGQDGRYELRVPAGRSHVYISGYPSRAYVDTSEGKNIVVGPDDTLRDNIDFELTRRKRPELIGARAVVRGRVLGPAGQPLEGVEISYDRFYQDGRHEIAYAAGKFLGYTGADGRYEFEIHLSKGFREDLRYRVVAGGDANSLARSGEFDSEPGAVNEMEDLRIRPTTSSLSGTIVDQDGHPVPGVRVTASSKSYNSSHAQFEILSDGNGRFHVKHVLGDEPLTVRTFKPGYQHAYIKDVEPGARNLRIELKAE